MTIEITVCDKIVHSAWDRIVQCLLSIVPTKSVSHTGIDTPPSVWIVTANPRGLSYGAGTPTGPRTSTKSTAGLKKWVQPKAMGQPGSIREIWSPVVCKGAIDLALLLSPGTSHSFSLRLNDLSDALTLMALQADRPGQLLLHRTGYYRYRTH